MKKIGLALSLWFLSLPVIAQNVVLVSQVGGDFSDPVAALEAIGTTLPPASPGNRYVVKINPGVYSVSDSVEMKPYVDLEGSGIKTTVIRGAIGSSFGTPSDIQGIINAASHSELRDLTIRNNWASSSAVAIAVDGTTGSAITNVRSVSRGEAVDSSAWKYGIFIVDSSGVRLTHVVARGTTSNDSLCQGVAARGSRVWISDSRLVGAAGSCTIGLGLNASMDSSVNVVNSTLRGGGSLNGISVSGSSTDSGEQTTIRIRHSMLDGAIFEGTSDESGTTTVLISHSQLTGPITGSPVCFSSHDPDLNGLTSTCIP